MLSQADKLNILELLGIRAKDARALIHRLDRNANYIPFLDTVSMIRQSIQVT